MYQQGYHPPNRPEPKSAKRNAKDVSPNGFAPYDMRVPLEARMPQREALKEYAASAGQKKPKPRAKPKSGIGRVLFITVVCCLLAFGAFYLKTYLEVQPYEKVFAPNVYVDNILLSGMTAQEGVDAVRNGVSSKTDSLVIRLMVGDREYKRIDSQMLGITYDVRDALNNAWAVGHRGTIFDRKGQIDGARNREAKFYSATPGANTEPVDALLVALKNEAYRAPQNASVTFNDDASDPFIYTAEVPGQQVDIEPLKQKIYEMVATAQGGDVQIELTPIAPEITAAALAQDRVLRSRAVTPIASDSVENRNNNIRRSFELLSGTVLKPGDKFSFNNVVGWRTEENGFFPALEYAYGELTEGIGGGVCQASTTVYLAAAQAGLEIVDREPHSGPVSYTDLGMDATVYMTKNRKIDFVFRNNTEGDIYIVAAVKSDPSNRKRLITEVKMYGPSLGDVSYEMVSKVMQEIPIPEPVDVKDKKGTYVIYVDERKEKAKGRKGYVVETYLVKKVGGQEAERKLLSKDTYEARAPQFYVGVTQR